MENRQIYLVENYNPSIKFNDDAIIVALTPLACYELDKERINYQIVQDFSGEEVWFGQEQAGYFKEQLSWFDDFDKLLISIFPQAEKLDLELASAYFFYIKTMVDSIVLRAKALDYLISSPGLKGVIFMSTDSRETIMNPVFPMYFWKSQSSQSLFSRLAPLLSEKYKLPFQRLTFNYANRINTDEKSGNSSGAHSKFFIPTNYARFIMRFIFGDLFSRCSNKFNYNLMFLYNSYNSFEIFEYARKSGCNIFYKEGTSIKMRNARYNKLMADIKPERDAEVFKNGNKVLQEINDANILGWINNHCGVNVSEIILPKIRYFINIFCPQFLILLEKYRSFYDDNRIDAVFTPYTISIDDYAALFATKYSRYTKSIQLQHGDSVFKSTWTNFLEYFPKYDAYAVTNNEAEQCIKDRISAIGYKTKVLQNMYRYKTVPKLNGLSANKRKLRSKKTVMYVSSLCLWDTKMWCNSYLPDSWYFTWQKTLLTYFSKRDDFNFIWNSKPHSDQVYNPIGDLINDKRYPNIRYSTKPLIKSLRDINMILLDYPSTPLYEGALSGLPVLSLLFKRFLDIRESALQLFGRSICPVYDFKEGIAEVEKFLNSDPKDFIVSIPITRVPIIDDLSAVLKESEQMICAG